MLKPDYLPPDSESLSVNHSMSRADSSSSLFSHISSVSQQFDTDTPSKRRGRPPKKQMPRLIDDNELSIQKATEEAFDSNTSSKSRAIQRRKSDLSALSSSSGSSAASAAKIEVVARLRANMQKIPANFGTNEKEVRVTRSKLRSIIEPNGSDTDNSQASDSKQVARRVTRRASKRVKELEQVKEEEVSSPKMSIKNLKKHNAAFEKMDIIADLKKPLDEEGGDEVSSGGRKTRVTRSMVTVSPTASSCVSESTLMSVASTSVAKGTPKTIGRRYVSS